MFYDLLTKYLNDYFYEVAAVRKNAEGAEHEGNNREFVKLFANKGTFWAAEKPAAGTKNQRKKLERTAHKMSAIKKRQTIVMTSKDDREELKGKKKTSSLEQEMNLARRACWCNNNLNDLRSQEELQQPTLQLKQKCCENCFKRLNDDNTKGEEEVKEENDDVYEICFVNENNDEADDDSDGDDKENVKETTVLNGAKHFSKNINTTINNNNKTIKTKTLNSLSSQRELSNTTNTTATNSLSCRKNLNNKTKMYEEDTIQFNLNTTSSKTKDAANNSFCFLSPVNNPTNNSQCHNNRFLAYLRTFLLQMWLAFVQFCDKNTIKSDDPRLAAPACHTEHKNQNKFSSHKTSAAFSAKRPATFQLKLLNNKKLLFLFVVCVFFSCLNRIEARPNVEQKSVLAEVLAITSTSTDINSIKSQDSVINGASNVSAMLFFNFVSIVIRFHFNI